MKERPILFNQEMVRAILDGRKTQTRRIIKLPQKHKWGTEYDGQVIFDDGSTFGHEMSVDEIRCPYGQVGDLLWVRETFSQVVNLGVDKNGNTASELFSYNYKADLTAPIGGYWKPSIFMPRAASRILLEITNVRVERLQSISEHDAIAEGCDNSKSESAISQGWYEKPVKAFFRLWESINGRESLDANPWVWVITFKVIEIKQ